MKQWAKQTGFTIVELLIVVVVIAILAAITIVAFNGISDRAKNSALQSEVNQATKKLETYKIQNADRYPDTLANAGIQENPNYTYVYIPSSSRSTYTLTVQGGAVVYYATSAQTTPTLPANDGLIAWWPLNGSTVDISGRGNTLSSTSVSAAAGQSLVPSSAYAFNGTSSYLEAPADTVINLNNSVGSRTFSIWYYATHSNSSDVRFLLARRSSDGSANTDFTIYLTEGYISFGTGSGDDCAWPASTTSTHKVTEPARNTWHHIVATINQTGSQTGTKKVWVDGIKRSDCTYTSKASGGTTPLRIGSRQTLGAADTYFQGSLDDVRIYNRVLTDDEIRTLYAQGAF